MLVPLPKSITVVCSPVAVADSVLFAMEVAFPAVLVALEEELELARLEEVELLEEDGRDEEEELRLLLLYDVHLEEEEDGVQVVDGVQVFCCCSSACQVVVGGCQVVLGGGGGGVH